MKLVVIIINLFLAFSCTIKSNNRNHSGNLLENQDSTNSRDPETIKKQEVQATAEIEKSLTPDIDRGQESQNGDWSFADNSRRLIEKSFQSFLWDIRLLDFGKFLEIIDASWVKDQFRNKEDLLNKFESFKQSIVIPENQQLLQMPISNEFIKVSDGEYILQLDFFLKYGYRWEKLEETYHTYTIKKLFLQTFAKHYGATELEAKTFANQFIDLALFSLVYQEIPLKKFIDNQVDLHQLVFFSRIFLTENAYNKVQAEIERENLQIDYFSYEPTYQKNDQGETYIQVYCDEMINCQESTKLLFYGSLRTKLYNQGEFVKDFKFFSNVSAKIISSSFNSYLAFSSHMGSDDLSLDQDILKGITIKPVQLEKNYNKAFQLLNTAKQELLRELKQIPVTEVQKIAEETKATSDSTQNLLELNSTPIQIIEKMENLSLEQVKSQKIGIKNFDYDLAEQKLLVQPSFYFSFFWNASAVKNEVNKILVKRLILHEFGHLYEFNDNLSRVFASNVIAYIHKEVPFDEGGQFLRMNDQQVSKQDFEKEQTEFEQRLQDTQIKSFIEVLNERGFTIDSSKTKVESQDLDLSCLIEDNSMSCQRFYNYLIRNKRYNVILEDVDGKRFSYYCSINSTVKLIGTNLGHGIITRRTFISSENEFIDFTVKLYDTSGNVVFELPDSDEDYDRVFDVEGTVKKYTVFEF